MCVCVCVWDQCDVGTNRPISRIWCEVTSRRVASLYTTYFAKIRNNKYAETPKCYATIYRNHKCRNYVRYLIFTSPLLKIIGMGGFVFRVQRGYINAFKGKTHIEGSDVIGCDPLTSVCGRSMFDHSIIYSRRPWRLSLELWESAKSAKTINIASYTFLWKGQRISSRIATSKLQAAGWCDIA